jgi:hypothetical protein
MVAIPAVQGNDVQQSGARHVADDGNSVGVQARACVLQGERRRVRRLPRQPHVPAEAGPADNLLRGRPHLPDLGRPDAPEQPHPGREGRRPVAAAGGEALAAPVLGAHQQRPQRHAARGALQELAPNPEGEREPILGPNPRVLEPLPRLLLQRLLDWPFRQRGAVWRAPSPLLLAHQPFHLRVGCTVCWLLRNAHH